MATDHNFKVKNGLHVLGSDGVYLIDTNTQLSQGGANSLKIQTNSGSIEIGSRNSAFAHIQTDRGQFYFNAKLNINSGTITSYDEDLLLQRIGTTKLTLGETSATFVDTIYAKDSNSATDPTISFVGHTDSGLSMSISGSNDQLSVITDGTRRAYFNSAGITSISNVYTSGGGQFRNYGAAWTASTGVTGNGFTFLNSVDGTAMTISSTGNVVVTGTLSATTVNTGQGATEVHLMNQNVRSSDSPTFQDLTIQGNLAITGDINSYNVTDLDVVDKTITLGVGGTASANSGGGIIIDGANAIFAWDNAQGSMTLNKELRLDNNKGLFFQNAAGNATVGLKADTSDNITFRQNGSWDKLVIKNTGIDVAGNIVVTGTVDGVDIATRNSVLTSTTTTANAALPKTGGTMTGALNAGGGISGLTLSNGISGNNYNISGVNQLTINDPGEGISFGGGSTTMNLAIVDDATDRILRYSGTGAVFDVVGTITADALVINKAAESLANQPSIISTFDSTGTDGLALISVEHLTNSGAAAMGAGIRFQVGDGTTGTADKQSYIFQRGGGQLPLVYIADKSHQFYVDHHDNDLTGTSYSDYGTLALTITETGNIDTTGRLYINQPSSNTSNELIIMRANDIYADQVWTDNTGSIRLRTNSGAFRVFTGGSASTNNASGSTEKFSVSSSGTATFTGNIVVSGTVDGVDIAARNGVLTSTTTTANAALPKAGGTITSGTGVGLTINHDTFGAGLRVHRNHASNAASIQFLNNGGRQGTLLGISTDNGLYWQIGTSTSNNKIFHDTYHPNADTLTTARTIAGSSFNGSANIDINFNNLAAKASGTGTYSTSGTLQAGRGSGGVALTVNDGYGNANVAFNHAYGTPEQNGQSARIEVNTDGTSTEGSMMFEVSSADVTSGTAVNLASAMTIYPTAVDFAQYLRHMSDTDTYIRFTADRVRIFAGNSNVFDSNTPPLTANQTITLTGDVSGSGTTSISVTVADDSHFHHRLDSTDDRDMKPSTSGIAGSVQAIKPFFSSYGGMTGTDNGVYVDVLAFDTYSDSSGGGPSAITFKKGNSAGNPEMHIWKAGWNATTWSTGQRVFADNYHPNADTLTTARTIAGTSFNGSANIDISYNNLTNKPSIPSLSGYATESYVGTQLTNLIDGAPGTLNTLNELAAAVADNNTFFSTVLVKTGGTMTGTLTSRDILVGAGYHLQRSDHHSGHLEGSYNNIGANGPKSNPIYTIGSSYNPASTTLGNMYGIGFCSTAHTGINFTGQSNWGMYVAADGDARVWLDGTAGVVSSTGEHYVGSSRVFHDTYHPNADTLTTARTINGVSFNGSANITVADSTKLPLSGGTLTGNLTIPNQIIHAGDTDTYFQFHAANQARIVAGGAEITEWRSDRMQMNNRSITFPTWTNFAETALSGFAFNALNAPIHIPAVNVGTADKYLPFLQGSAQHTQGYRTSYVLGGFKQGTTGAGWGDGQTGFFMAMGGSDSNPTKEFRFTWDGRIWYTDAGAASYLDFDTANTLKFIADNNETLNLTSSTATINANLTLAAENTTGTNSIHLPRGGRISFYGDTSAHHGIASTNNTSVVTDDLTISSYGAVYIDLDSNNNNTSAADFIVGKHNGANTLFKVDGETGAGTGIHSYPNLGHDGVSLMTYSQGTVPVAQGVVQIRSNGKTGWANGDEMGSIDWFNNDGSGVGARNLARIVAVNSQGNGTSTTTFNGEIHFYTSAYNAQLNAAPAMRLTTDNAVVIGDGTDASSCLKIMPADDGTADDIQFYNGTTLVGSIGTQDTTWLRINQATSKNIYTPRYIRADNGFFVDNTSTGIDGGGNFIGGGNGTFGTLTASGNLSANGSLFGQGIRASGRGEIHLNSSAANTVSEIFFSYGAGFTEANIRWGISDRGTTDDRLVIYKGPANGGFTEVAAFDASENTLSVANGYKVGTHTVIDSAYNITAGTGYITGTRLRAGDGTDGYFYSDSAGRTAFNGGDFYIRSEVTNCYLYAANTYLGASSGDNIRFRANNVIADSWGITSGGVVSAAEFELPSSGMLDWANGDARIVEGLVSNYSLSFQTFDGSNCNTALRLDGDNDAYFEGNIYGKSVNAAHSALYKFGGIYFTWDSDSYGTNTHHSIRSTDGDSYGDHITLNSFGNVRINFDSNGNGTNYFRIGHHTTGTDGVLLTIDESGNATFAGNVTAYSDIRLKENIVNIDNALDKVCSMRGIYYNMIADTTKSRRLGLVAQEVEKVLPEVVIEAKPEDDKESVLSVDYGNIVALLIEGMKEQQIQIDKLEEQVEQLKEK